MNLNHLFTSFILPYSYVPKYNPVFLTCGIQCIGLTRRLLAPLNRHLQSVEHNFAFDAMKTKNPEEVKQKPHNSIFRPWAFLVA